MKAGLRALLLRQWPNLFAKPFQFDDPFYWLTATATISADGTLTSSGAAGYLYSADTAAFAAAGGRAYEMSADVVAGSVSSMTLLVAGAATYNATFDLAALSVSGVSANTEATITDMGGGLRRCNMVMTGVANIGYTEFQIGRIGVGATIRLLRASLRRR